jgi:hypothetical protein
MVDLLRRRGVEAKDLDSMRLRLSPPGWEKDADLVASSADIEAAKE